MSKYSALFEDEDDIFLGSPRSKFLDTVYNANQDQAMNELEIIIERMATMEILMEEHLGGIEAVEHSIKQTQLTRTDEVQAQAKNAYIVHMGSILSQSE